MDAAFLSDPWVLAQIEAAVAPYVGRLPAEEVEWMRQQLAEVLFEDAAAARLLRGARPRDVDESGEMVCAPRSGADDGRAKAGQR